MRHFRSLAVIGGVALAATLTQPAPAGAFNSHGRGAFAPPGRSASYASNRRAARSYCRAAPRATTYWTGRRTYAAYVPSQPAAVNSSTTSGATSDRAASYGAANYGGSSSGGSYAATAIVGALAAAVPAETPVPAPAPSGARGRYVDANGNVWIERQSTSQREATARIAPRPLAAAEPATAPSRTTRVIRATPSSSVEYDGEGRPWIRRYVAGAESSGSGLGHAARTLRVVRDDVARLPTPAATAQQPTPEPAREVAPQRMRTVRTAPSYPAPPPPQRFVSAPDTCFT